MGHKGKYIDERNMDVHHIPRSVFMLDRGEQRQVQKHRFLELAIVKTPTFREEAPLLQVHGVAC